MMVRTWIRAAVFDAGLRADGGAGGSSRAGRDRARGLRPGRARRRSHRAVSPGQRAAASGQAVTAAEQAADAFTAADGVRDAALAAYRVAYRESAGGRGHLRQRPPLHQRQERSVRRLRDDGPQWTGQNRRVCPAWSYWPVLGVHRGRRRSRRWPNGSASDSRCRRLR